MIVQKQLPFTIATAISALAIGAMPAAAQQGGYHYPEYPTPEPEIVSQDVVDWPQAPNIEFVSEPVIQDISNYPPEYQYEPHYQYEYDYDYEYVRDQAHVEPYPLPLEYPEPASPVRGYSDEERDEWLKQCRSRYSDNGLGGALIGGLIGGVAGNRIAGEGNRAVGTIAGAVVGAAAGAAIDKAEDRGRARDECEDYLERYEASGGQYNPYGQAHYSQAQYGYGQLYPAYAYPHPAHTAHSQGCGHAVAYAYQPVAMPRPQTQKRVYVTEEYVTVHETPAAKPAPAKRVRRVVAPAPQPDKRIRYVK
jgi:hypothetical protein